MGSANFDSFTTTLTIRGSNVACFWMERHKPPITNFTTYIKSKIFLNGQAVSEEIFIDDNSTDALRANPVIIWHNDTTLFAIWSRNGNQSFEPAYTDIYYKKLFLNPFRKAMSYDRIINNSKLHLSGLHPSIIKKKNSEGYLIIMSEQDSLGYWNVTCSSVDDSLISNTTKITVKEKVKPPTSWMSNAIILQKQNGNFIVIW